ncbi:MAG: hypothetical protein ACHQDB_02120 [Steroidobacterales bacterium]
MNAGPHPRSWHRAGASSALWLLAAGLLNAQTPPSQPLGPNSNFGPHNSIFLAGGVGLANPLAPDSPLLNGAASWYSMPPPTPPRLAPVGVARLLAREGLVLVVLTLTDSHNAVLSNNFYWQARADADLKRLTALPQQPPAIVCCRRSTATTM